MAEQQLNTPQNENPNIRKLLLFIGAAVAAFALWAIFGSLLTGNKPDSPKGAGAVTAGDSAYVTESDTLKTQ